MMTSKERVIRDRVDRLKSLGRPVDPAVSVLLMEVSRLRSEVSRLRLVRRQPREMVAWGPLSGLSPEEMEVGR